jgi:poly(3-hydroxyalkanoate) depolymerase
MITVAGTSVRVAVRAGDPAWPPLLLCNGIGASLELLQPLVEALGQEREVIRFDLPGVGGSPAPLVPYHMVTLPPLLAGILEHCGHSRADVLGISWGGGLAQQFALACPGLVRRLVLVATGTGVLMVPADPWVLRHLLLPSRHHDPGYAARTGGEIYGGSLRDAPERAAELLRSATRPAALRGYYYQLLAAAGWTSLPMLPLLPHPTLLLAGDDDPLVPLLNARLMHWLIHDSQLHVYHGGHLELIASPHLLAPVIEQFLNAGTPAA